MGAKAKKLMKKNLSKVTSQLGICPFFAIGRWSWEKAPVQKPLENAATELSTLDVGRIPHGFYEKEMQGFFSQFGEVRRLRIAQNKKTGKSKHFGFIKFGSPEVAKIVADSMHNYLHHDHIWKVHLIPPEHVHPKLTLEEHKKLLEGTVKQNQIKRKRIKAAGINCGKHPASSTEDRI